MDDMEDYSALANFPTSTEMSIFYEFVTTTNPFDMTDQASETSTIHGMFVLYGLGGILVFFVVYMICYSYFLHMKEVAEEHEMEIRRLNERNSTVSYRRPPMDEGRIFIEDYSTRMNPNPTWLRPGRYDIDRQRENMDREEERNGTVLITDIDIPTRTPQEILERKYFPEDFQDLLCSNQRQQVENSHTFSQKAESSDSLGGFGWISEPPLCFSTPEDSKERIFFPEDFQDLLCPNAEARKNANPENQTSHENSETTPMKVKESPSTPEVQSQSSPTSPDIVRRRLHALEGTPKRPSSWQ